MYTENTRIGKSRFPASATLEQIHEYSTKVLKGLIACILPPCPECGLEAVWFKRHEARKRKFNVVVDQLVVVAICLLIRWKCRACGKTFTQYPDFALPYKRYTAPTIMDFASAYTEDESATYRKTVRKVPVGYRDDERQLEHSTVHRWLCSLGRMTTTIAKAADTILQAAPCSNACRDAAKLSVRPAKYRSQRRKSLLERCRRLFFFEAVLRETRGLSIFPKLATVCGYG